MPIVYSTIEDPSGNPLRGTYVEARLAVEEQTHVYRPADEVSIASRSRTYTNNVGRWELDLTANTLVTPSNTVYEVIEALSTGRRVSYIVVPNSVGPHWLEDLLVDPPTNLPAPSGWNDHLLDSAAAHSAASIAFTPAGAISASNVQNAIEELADEAGDDVLPVPEWKSQIIVPELDGNGDPTGAWVVGYLEDLAELYFTLDGLKDVAGGQADGDILVWSVDNEQWEPEPPVVSTVTILDVDTILTVEQITGTIIFDTSGGDLTVDLPPNSPFNPVVPEGLSVEIVVVGGNKVTLVAHDYAPSGPEYLINGSATLEVTGQTQLAVLDGSWSASVVSSSGTLDDLTDVDTSGGSPGWQILYNDGVSWFATDIRDFLVNIYGFGLNGNLYDTQNLVPNHGDLMVWDGDNSEWIGVPGSTPNNGEVLVWSSVDNGWTTASNNLSVYSISSGPSSTTGSGVLLVDATSGDIDIDLAEPFTSGDQVVVKKIDSSVNVVNVTSTGHSIDGAASVVLDTQHQSRTLVCDGTDWWLI